jgi:hypothetical protein
VLQTTPLTEPHMLLVTPTDHVTLLDQLYPEQPPDSDSTAEQAKRSGQSQDTKPLSNLLTCTTSSCSNAGASTSTGLKLLTHRTSSSCCCNCLPPSCPNLPLPTSPAAAAVAGCPTSLVGGLCPHLAVPSCPLPLSPSAPAPPACPTLTADRCFCVAVPSCPLLFHPQAYTAPSLLTHTV